MLILGNLYVLNKSQAKSYAKKKSTIQKLKTFFDNERKNMSEDEICELDSVLSYFFSIRERIEMTKKMNHLGLNQKQHIKLYKLGAANE